MTLSPSWFLNATGQFTPIGGASTSTSTSMFTTLTKATTADIASSGTTSSYVDGPSVSQGTSGIWFASGTLTITGPGAANGFANVKLWDGTTVIASAQGLVLSGDTLPFTLSGVLASPAGNLRLSFLCATNSRSVTASFNATGNSADCTITAIRIG